MQYAQTTKPLVQFARKEILEAVPNAEAIRHDIPVLQDELLLLHLLHHALHCQHDSRGPFYDAQPLTQYSNRQQERTT